MHEEDPGDEVAFPFFSRLFCSSYTADDQITGACEGVLESEPLYYDENPSDVSSFVLK